MSVEGNSCFCNYTKTKLTFSMQIIVGKAVLIHNLRLRFERFVYVCIFKGFVDLHIHLSVGVISESILNTNRLNK